MPTHGDDQPSRKGVPHGVASWKVCQIAAWLRAGAVARSRSLAASDGENRRTRHAVVGIVKRTDEGLTKMSLICCWDCDCFAAFPNRVQVTACLLVQKPAQTRGGGVVGMVRSSTVSSKLSSGKWPRPESVANSIVRILRQWGALQQQPHQQQQQQHQQRQSQQQQEQQRQQGTPVGSSQGGVGADATGAGGKDGRSEGTAALRPAVGPSPEKRPDTGDNAGSAATSTPDVADLASTVALGPGSSDEAQGEGPNARLPTEAMVAVVCTEGGAAARAEETQERRTEECGPRGRVDIKKYSKGSFTSPKLVGGACDTGVSEDIVGGEAATRTGTLETFGLGVEDAFVEVRKLTALALSSTLAPTEEAYR